MRRSNLRVTPCRQEVRLCPGRLTFQISTTPNLGILLVPKTAARRCIIKSRLGGCYNSVCALFYGCPAPRTILARWAVSTSGRRPRVRREEPPANTRKADETVKLLPPNDDNGDRWISGDRLLLPDVIDFLGDTRYYIKEHIGLPYTAQVQIDCSSHTPASHRTWYKRGHCSTPLQLQTKENKCILHNHLYNDY